MNCIRSEYLCQVKRLMHDKDSFKEKGMLLRFHQDLEKEFSIMVLKIRKIKKT